MILVKATREGLPGSITASGHTVDAVVPFVALPSVFALRQRIRIINPRNGKVVHAVVLDVGPWNERDHAYVFQPSTLGPHPQAASPGSAPYTPIRPAAEAGVDSRGRKTNGAGIDLGEAVWRALGMTDNDVVLWEFIGADAG